MTALRTPQFLLTEEVISHTYEHPIQRLRVWRNEVTFTLRTLGGRIWLMELFSLFPGKGNATEFLLWLGHMADKHGIPLYLEPLPFVRGKKYLKKKQLIKWYRQFGFEFVDECGTMMREPRSNGG